MLLLKIATLVALIIISTNSQASIFGLFGKENLLINAVESSDVSQVQSLLKNGYDINSVNSIKQTSLMKAAIDGNSQMIGVLLSYGADVNKVDGSGNTALHYAALNNDVSSSRMLINRGANIELVNEQGLTAIDLAVKSGSVDFIKDIAPNMLTIVEAEAGFPAVAGAVVSTGGFSTSTVVIASAGAAAGVGVAVASGGGGGDSESSNTVPDSDNNSSEDSNDNGGNDSTPDSDNNDTGGNDTPPPASCNDRFIGSEFSAVLLLCPSSYLSQYSLGAINADVAYESNYTGNGVVVAVVDTGVDLNHVELDDNIAPGGINFFDEIYEGGNGSHDADSSSTINDDYWHGTHVAGIIAAEKNGIASHGVAYNAKILPINIYTQNDGIYDVDVARGIDYAVAQGADIINLSLGSSSSSAMLNTIASI